jgi:trehalose 6-phosphate synthase
MVGVSESEVLVASNRGPVSFSVAENGTLSASRGGGGLVSAMTAVGTKFTVRWVCAAISNGDREAVRRANELEKSRAAASAVGTPPGRPLRGGVEQLGPEVGVNSLRMLDIDPGIFDRAYNTVANSILWFVHHLLYSLPTNPRFDSGFVREWDAFESYNRAFAEALAEEAPPEGRILVQDYHLTLVPGMLRVLRPDVRIAHFSHTPFAPPDYFRMLPDDTARAVLTGILGADHAGFLSERWALSFMDCCEQLLSAPRGITHDDDAAEPGEPGGGARIDREAMTVTYNGRITRTAVHALGVDAEFLRERAAQSDVATRRDTLREFVGDRKVIVRVDRAELSKNIVRGLEAYRELLRRHPEWRNWVVHLVFVAPSRFDVPDYLEYTAAVQRVAKEILDEFSTPHWQPLMLQVEEDLPGAFAAFGFADVLVVNPIRDGMNLVAKEGPVVSDKGLTLVLSREAGAASDLGDDALLVNPYDVTETAEAIHLALSMPEEERAEHTRRLVVAATALPPAQWFADQLDALDGWTAY